MTCAQGLLRLLWGGGGPKLECYGTDLDVYIFDVMLIVVVTFAPTPSSDVSCNKSDFASSFLDKINI